MTLRARVRLIWIVITVAVTCASWYGSQIAHRDPVKTAFLVLLPLLAVLVAVQVVLVRRAQRQLERAFAADDLPALRSHLGELSDYFRGQPRIRERLRLGSAQVAMAEERYAEARAILESLDQNVLGEELLPNIQSATAFCMTHLGETSAAVELARTAVGRVGGADDDRVADLLGILGACLVQDGQPGDGVPILQKAIGRGAGQPRGQAVRAYYLGEGLQALGRSADARAAWERAVAAAPASRFAGRARERLAAPAGPSPPPPGEPPRVS
jgi:predicted Zn-dependent protease